MDRIRIGNAWVGFYRSKQRAEQKSAQRREDAADVAAGRLAAVEGRNHWINALARSWRKAPQGKGPLA